MNTAIQVCHLTKSYGSRAVIKGVSFQIQKGEIFALLGANGAGKTTVLECVEGLRRYDSGQITINGTVGIQLQSAALPSYIRPMEAVKLFARWKRAKLDDKLLNALDIQGLGKQMYGRLSTGQKRRLQLALALVGDPEIIFLDEPTARLDVCSRQELHAHIRRLKAKGKTIVLASHDMAEVELLCDRIGILKDGNMLFCDTAARLKDQMGKHYIIHIKTEQGSERIETSDIESTLISILTKLKQSGARILDMQVDRGSLESILFPQTMSQADMGAENLSQTDVGAEKLASVCTGQIGDGGSRKSDEEHREG